MYVNTYVCTYVCIRMIMSNFTQSIVVKGNLLMQWCQMIAADANKVNDGHKIDEEKKRLRK